MRNLPEGSINIRILQRNQGAAPSVMVMMNFYRTLRFPVASNRRSSTLFLPNLAGLRHGFATKAAAAPGLLRGDWHTGVTVLHSPEVNHCVLHTAKCWFEAPDGFMLLCSCCACVFRSCSTIEYEEEA